MCSICEPRCVQNEYILLALLFYMELFIFQFYLYFKNYYVFCPFQNGIFWGSIILCLSILLGGFLAILTHMPTILYYVSFLDYIRYAVEAMADTMYKKRGLLPCPDTSIYCHFKYPHKILIEVGMDNVNYWVDAGILVGFCVFFMFNGYFFLHRKVKSRWIL